MYSRYAKTIAGRQGLENSIGVGGYKEVIFEIRRAFSKLKYESGVPRVQRVPRPRHRDRIHTSTPQCSGGGG
jgi:peptide chain release factor 1